MTHSKPATTPERNRDLAAIHKGARRLGMGEFQRRALQYAETGRESCLEMTATERAAVIAELERVRRQSAPLSPSDYSDDAMLDLLNGVGF